MAKLEVLIVLLLHWHTVSSNAGASATASVVATRDRRSLGSQQQLRAGGDLGEHILPLAPAPAPAPSPTLRSGNSGKDGQMSPHYPSPPLPPRQPPPPQEPEICTYEVMTQTGSKWTAGTGSTISVRFSSSEGESIFMVLTKEGFSTGELAVLKVEGQCVHGICKMELSSDASGYLPSWYADYVSVKVSSPETTVDSCSFTVDEWLPAHEWSPAASLVRDQCH